MSAPRSFRLRSIPLAGAAVLLGGIIAAGFAGPGNAVPDSTPAPASSAPPGFVAESHVSATSQRLRFQAPNGSVQWTLTRHCEVTDRWLPPGNGSGGSGAACGASSGTRFPIANRGGSAENGVFLSYLGGWIANQQATGVRVSLASGQTETLPLRHGFWLAITQRCGDIEGSGFVRADLLGSGERVLASKRVVESAEMARHVADICSGDNPW